MSCSRPTTGPDTSLNLPHRAVGNSSTDVSCVGFGAFKIGRNEGIKYPRKYALPDDGECERLLNGVLDAGITLIDTAPAYGLSEQRIGQFISHRRREFRLSTKVGETFADGQSHFDFTSAGIQASLHRSLKRLRTDTLDLLLLHSSGDDLKLLNETDAVESLQQLKHSGAARHIGLSGKTVQGAAAALEWADVLMVEYHAEDKSHSDVMHRAAAQGVGVVVKKGLASGHLKAPEAISFVLEHPAVDSLVIGGLNLEHLRANISSASLARGADV